MVKLIKTFEINIKYFNALPKKKKIKDLKILKELKKKSEILLQQMNFLMLHKNLCFCYFNTFCSILLLKIIVSYLDTKRESVCFVHSTVCIATSE
jgi:hypothetical protein